MTPSAMPPLPLVDNVFFIDNSILEHYTTCRRSYEYIGLHRRTLRETRSALTFGGLIHRALEVRYRWEATEPIRLSVPDEIERQQFALIEAHFRANPPADGDHRTAAFAQEIILLYNKFYLAEPFMVARDANGNPMVEVPFALKLGILPHPITGVPVTIMWTGRIDLIAYWSNNAVLHGDHKTTSMGGERYFNDFVLDQAQRGYTWAVQKIIGRPVDGFFINCIIARKPTLTGKGIEFARRKFPVDQDSINEFEENTLALVGDLFRDYARGYFPMETKWCGGKYGPCQYVDVCNVPRQGRGVILHGNLYQDHDWSPLNKPTTTNI